MALIELNVKAKREPPPEIKIPPIQKGKVLLEMGKEYITNDGKKALVVREPQENHPYFKLRLSDGREFWYWPDGRWAGEAADYCLSIYGPWWEWAKEEMAWRNGATIQYKLKKKTPIVPEWKPFPHHLPGIDHYLRAYSTDFVYRIKP